MTTTDSLGKGGFENYLTSICQTDELMDFALSRVLKIIPTFVFVHQKFKDESGEIVRELLRSNWPSYLLFLVTSSLRAKHEERLVHPRLPMAAIYWWKQWTEIAVGTGKPKSKHARQSVALSRQIMPLFLTKNHEAFLEFGLELRKLVWIQLSQGIPRK